MNFSKLKFSLHSSSMTKYRYMSSDVKYGFNKSFSKNSKNTTLGITFRFVNKPTFEE